MAEELSDEELFGASAGVPNGQVDSSPAASIEHTLAAPDADPDEEPPEPEGHALTEEMASFIKGGSFFRGPLPFDLAAVWAHPPMRRDDEATARILIDAWGVDGFRGSALHQAALQQVARDSAAAPSRQQFKAEREKAKKKR
jgi:hypothetical protein